MTLEFMRNEIHHMIGEPSDIDPDTDVQYGGGPLLTFVVNEGLRTVATWKDPGTDRAVRLPEFLGETLFRSYVTSGDLDADSADGTIVLPAGSSAVDDAYNGWVVTVDGTSRYIADYDGATLTGTLTEDWGTAPESGDAYTLSKNFHLLVESTDDLAAYHIVTPAAGGYHTGNFLLPLKVVDVGNTRDLAKMKDTESFAGMVTQTGTPTEWGWTANRLVFNMVPDERLWYRFEYYRLPKVLAADDDEPDIPAFLQYGVVLWGRWWGYARQQALPEAYSAKRDFVDFMQQRLNLYSVEYLREDDFATMRVD